MLRIKRLCLALIIVLSTLALSISGLGVFFNNTHSYADDREEVYFSSMKELQDFANSHVADWYMDKIFILQSDIDLDKEVIQGGVLLSNSIFDGNGHTISGGRSSYGFFEAIYNSVIKNLRLEGHKVYHDGEQFEDYIGGLVGLAHNSRIENVMLINCSIEAIENGWRASQSAGGLIGVATANCSVYSVSLINTNIKVQCQDDAQYINAGGIIGQLTTSTTGDIIIDQCFYYGEIYFQTQYNSGNNNIAFNKDPYGSVDGASIGGLIGYAVRKEYSSIQISSSWSFITNSDFKPNNWDDKERNFHHNDSQHLNGIEAKGGGKRVEIISPSGSFTYFYDLKKIAGFYVGYYKSSGSGYTFHIEYTNLNDNSSINNCVSNLNGDSKDIEYYKKLGTYTEELNWDNIVTKLDTKELNKWFHFYTYDKDVNDGFPVQGELLDIADYSVVASKGGHVKGEDVIYIENRFYKAFGEGGHIDINKERIDYLGQSFIAEAEEGYEFAKWSYCNEKLTANFKIKEYNIKLNKYSSNMESNTDNKGKFALNTDVLLNVADYGNRYEFTVVYDTSIYCYDDGGYGWSINFWENLGDGYGSFDAIPARDGSLKISKLTGIRIGERVYKLAELGQDKDRRVQEFCRDDNRTITITPVFEYLTWSIDLETISTTGRGGVGSYKIEKKDNTDPGSIDENKIVIRVADGWTVKYYTGGVYPTLQLVNKGVTKYTLTVSPEDGYYAASKWRIKLGNSSQDISQNSNIALSGDATITAVLSPIVYNINYEYENSRNNISKITGTYTVEDDITLTRNITDKPADRQFGFWLIELSSTDLSGTVSGSNFSYKVVGNNITLKTGDAVIVFEGVDSSNPNTNFITTREKKYYYAVRGIKSGSYGDTPTLTLRWSRIYNMTIANDGVGGNIWSSGIGSELEEKNTLIGVGGYGTNVTTGNINGSPTVTLRVVDNGDYEYKFADNKSYAFYKSADWANLELNNQPNKAKNSYYYLYNYGYEITHWTIKLEVNGDVYYINVDKYNNVWSTSNVEVQVPVDALNSASGRNGFIGLARFAEYASDLYAGKIVGEVKVILTPVWKSATINCVNSISNGSVRTSYNNPYTLIAGDISGQSLVYFTTPKREDQGENPVIAVKGSWNYYKLNKSNYSYVNNIYKINLTPVYVDNIYRIVLIDVAAYDGSYILENNSYRFVECDASMPSQITATIDGKTVKIYDPKEKYPLIDNYIPNLIQACDSYQTSVENGTNDRFGKIYCRNVEENISSNSIKATEGVELYIYLGNGQETNLPVFRKAFEVLTAWKNGGTSSDASGKDKRYIYTTEEYNKDPDTYRVDFNNNSLTVSKDAVWGYADGSGNIELKAHYYTKHYKITASTFEEQILGRYGYILMQGTDKEGQKQYMAIYNESTKSMELYIWRGTLALSYRPSNKVDEFKFYAGADLEVNVIDQSIDHTEDIFIGYRVSSLTNGQYIEWLNDGTYSNTLTAANIDAEGLVNGSQLHIIANYEKIKYSVTVEIGDGSNTSGWLDITIDGNTSYYTTQPSVEITGLKIGTSLSIHYNAQIGYEYDTPAMAIYNSDGEKIVDLTDGYFNREGQVYTVVIDGAWLREKYYSKVDEDYSVNDENLGKAKVNTKEIEFKLGVRYYDEYTGSYIEKYNNGVTTYEERSLGTWSYSKGEVGLAGAFDDIAEASMYGTKIADKEYVVRFSCAYDAYTAGNLNRYRKNYAYPLDEVPNTTYTIEPRLLQYLVKNTVNVIVDNSNRNIYFVLGVRQLLTLDMEVETLEGDSESSKRSTTLRIEDYTKEITTLGNTYTEERAYTYKGGDNTLSSKMDNKRYTGVEYYLDGEKVQTGNIRLTDNGKLTIKYIPKILETKVEYRLGGKVVSTAELSGITEGIRLKSEGKLYLGKEIQVERGNTGADYDITIYVNTNTHTLDSNDRYTVVDEDYEYGELKFIVEIEEHSNQEVIVEIVLKSNNLPKDEYGEFRLYVGDILQEGLNAKQVFEGRKIELKMELNAGYKYVGYKRGNGSEQEGEIREIEGVQVLTLESEFKPGNSYAKYTVYIEKEIYTAVLQVGSEQEKIYDISSYGTEKRQNADSSEISLSGVYVGKGITFSAKASKTEGVRYYYQAYGEETEEIELKDNVLELTSEILSRAEEGKIYFKVATDKKYKIEEVVERGEYLETREISVEIGNRENPEYHIAGTVIGYRYKGKLEEKYIVKVNIYRLEGGEERELLESKESDREIDGEIELRSDIRIRVSVERRKYGVEIEEYVYRSLEDLETGVEKETEVGVEVTYTEQRYGEIGVIRLDRRQEVAGEVRIVERIVIEDEEGIVEIDLTDPRGSKYEISEIEGVIEIRYEVKSGLRIELHSFNEKIILA